MSTPASASSTTTELTVNINLDENEPLGVRPNDGLVITEVQEGTPAYGNLKIGDTILEVNNRAMHDVRQFYKVCAVAHPVASIKVRRPNTLDDVPVEVREKLGAGDNLPPLERRTGYQYSLVHVDRVPGLKFGLAIKTRDNRVTVTEVRNESICAPHLKVLDHLVYINGQRVTQAEVAQQLMTRGMKEKGAMDCVVGRPSTPQAIQKAQEALKREDAHDPPSVRLNVDVQQIMRNQIVTMMVTPHSARPILNKSPSTPAPNRHVSFTGQNNVVPIQSDHAGRALRAVTTGVPNSPIRQQFTQQ